MRRVKISTLKLKPQYRERKRIPITEGVRGGREGKLVVVECHQSNKRTNRKSYRMGAKKTDTQKKAEKGNVEHGAKVRRRIDKNGLEHASVSSGPEEDFHSIVVFRAWVFFLRPI
ncbi:hypothetical protein GWI33_017911 [Rhynchophorus ferrugineus]|uniref:Uncharacterized protein n=1 Tax=Rhynchophorus ferrugineus TaxID=354439 RepID=A0A834HYU8_RHYFE|nr:hypothetical protein GWI33_017911 [Rhynchophorus ferrugineus]